MDLQMNISAVSKKQKKQNQKSKESDLKSKNLNDAQREGYSFVSKPAFEGKTIARKRNVQQRDANSTSVFSLLKSTNTQPERVANDGEIINTSSVSPFKGNNKFKLKQNASFAKESPLKSDKETKKNNDAKNMKEYNKREIFGKNNVVEFSGNDSASKNDKKHKQNSGFNSFKGKYKDSDVVEFPDDDDDGKYNKKHDESYSFKKKSNERDSGVAQRHFDDKESPEYSGKWDKKNKQKSEKNKIAGIDQSRFRDDGTIDFSEEPVEKKYRSNDEGNTFKKNLKNKREYLKDDFEKTNNDNDTQFRRDVNTKNDLNDSLRSSKNSYKEVYDDADVSFKSPKKNIKEKMAGIDQDCFKEDGTIDFASEKKRKNDDKAFKKNVKDVKEKKADDGLPSHKQISALFKNNPEIPRIGQRHVKPISEQVFSGKSFSDLNIHAFSIANLEKNMGLEQLTVVQQKATPVILKGRDVLVRSQTGSGKTLAYALPIVEALQALRPKLKRQDGLKALVIVPTRELALQTYELFLKLVRPFTWIVPGYLIGGENRKAEKARIRKGFNILIGTPGRVCDHLLHTASLKLNDTRCLILDEADRLLDMGYEKDVASIVQTLDRHKAASGYNPMALMKQSISKAHIHFGEEEENQEYPEEGDQQDPEPCSAKETAAEETAAYQHELSNVFLSDKRQTILLSATLTKAVETLAGLTMEDPVFIDSSEGRATLIADSIIKPVIVNQPDDTTADRSDDDGDDEFEIVPKEESESEGESKNKKKKTNKKTVQKEETSSEDDDAEIFNLKKKIKKEKTDSDNDESDSENDDKKKVNEDADSENDETNSEEEEDVENKDSESDETDSEDDDEESDLRKKVVKKVIDRVKIKIEKNSEDGESDSDEDSGDDDESGDDESDDSDDESDKEAAIKEELKKQPIYRGLKAFGGIQIKKEDSKVKTKKEKKAEHKAQKKNKEKEDVNPVPSVEKKLTKKEKKALQKDVVKEEKVKIKVEYEEDSDSDYDIFSATKNDPKKVIVQEKKVEVDTEYVTEVGTHSNPFQHALQNAIAQDEMVIPSSVTQVYIITPMKLRLITLAALIIERCITPGSGKILIFMATQDMIDYHCEILSRVLAGKMPKDLTIESKETALKKAKKERKNKNSKSDLVSSQHVEDDEDNKKRVEEDAADLDEDEKVGKNSDSKHGDKGGDDYQFEYDGMSLETYKAKQAASKAFVDVEFFQLHGSMDQRTRTEVFKTFRKVKSGVLLCTDVAARGLDLPHVDCIVQYTGPISATDYVHRVGRTARAGNVGTAIMLLLPSEVLFVRQLEERRIRLHQENMDSTLKALVPSPSRGLGFRQAGGPDPQQAAAAALQNTFEELAIADKALHMKGCKAFTSWMRFYSTYPREARGAFDRRALHTGHAARALALKETPKVLAATARPAQQQRDKKPRPDKKPSSQTGALGGPRNSLKSARRDQRMLVSEFESGLGAPPAKKPKEGKKR